MAEKHAAIPHMDITRTSSSSKRRSSPMLCPREPPSCNAAPSRPTDAPKRWDSSVPAVISGASIMGICSLVVTDVITRLVPASKLTRQSR